MKKAAEIILILTIGMTLLTGCSKVEQFSEPEKGETVAEIVIKDYGSVYVKFFKDEAPKAVENFTTHSEEGYYNGLTFHRVINDFMIQGGDPSGTGREGESIWGDKFEDEFSDSLHPYRGALCMANAGPDTNGSQFFIVQAKETYDKDTLTVLGRNTGVEFSDEAVTKYGEVGGTPWLYRQHTVFGQVYEGLDVLDAAAAVETDGDDKPVKDVIIEEIKVFQYEEE